MQTELGTSVEASISDIGGWFAANQSRLITALVLLAAGVVLAIVLRMIAVRAVRALERAMPGRSFRTSFGGVGRERQASDIVGTVVAWAVLLFFTATAAEALDLPLLSAAVESLSAFVPRVLIAVLILVTGLVLGNVARGALTAAAARAGAMFAPGLGQIVRLAILVAATLIAMAELGVDITLLTAIITVAFAALLGGFALAFGLGARTAISNIIGSHYMRQSFEVGQTVRVGEVEGRIAAITATALVLEVAEGRMIVPAKQFSEMPVTLVVRGGAS